MFLNQNPENRTCAITWSVNPFLNPSVVGAVGEVAILRASSLQAQANMHSGLPQWAGANGLRDITSQTQPNLEQIIESYDLKTGLMEPFELQDY